MHYLSLIFPPSHSRPLFLQITKNTNHNNSMFVERTKEKHGVTSHVLKMADCAFCVHPSKEIKLLLKAVLLKTSKMLTLKKYCQLEDKEEDNGPQNAVSRIIRVLFDKQKLETKYSRDCNHSRLIKLFSERLKCTPYQLQNLLNDLTDNIARRSYELEVIGLQVKHVESSVQQLQESTQTSPKTRKDSNSISSIQPPLVKLEQRAYGQGLAPQMNEQPRLGYESGPLCYNIIYYGQW